MASIWFVDDDKEMSEAIGLMLRVIDHTMRSFTEARLAVRALTQGERPDLLLLDISMPEISGIDMLEFIRRKPEWRNLPIVMLSSEAFDAQIDRALALGADGFVGKPVTIEELDVAIEQAIQKHQSGS
ncbi:MAG: response regulator [Anaerolineales bacterium]|nr:response regulator [Anaerolineales bacterium]